MDDVRRTLFAGAFANVTECCVCHPIDSVKTRQQLVSGGNVGIVASLRTMYGHGGLREVYRGLLPAVGMQAPRGMIKFASNATALGKLTKADGKPSLCGAVLAGGFAGALESFFITPFELLKVKLQSSSNLMLYKNTFDAVPRIVQQEGIFALWSGLAATLIRNGSWNAVYFGTIHFQRSEQKVFQTNSFVQGMIAGAFGSCFSNPVDVVKTRIQNGAAQPYFGRIPRVFFDVVRNEGILALYKGFPAKVLRLGPGGGILLVAFDTGTELYDFMKQ